MRYLLLIIAIMGFSIASVNAADEIVAIVNKQPITLSELEQRKKFMRFFNNVPHLSAEQEKVFTANVLSNMVDDEVLTQYGEKNRIKVSDADIQTFINNVETGNKMPAGQLEKSVLGAHISKTTFMDKLRVEVLRSKIIHEVLGQQISVTRSDVDSIILDTNSRDARLSLKVFTAKRDNDKAYNSMSKLSSRIKGCKHISRYQSFATISEMDTTLSALSPKVQNLVKDMSVGQATGVIKDDKMQVFVLCARQIEGFSDDEAIQVSNLVANKQLGAKAKKFIQTLRKKAYVKILM